LATNTLTRQRNPDPHNLRFRRRHHPLRSCIARSYFPALGLAAGYKEPALCIPNPDNQYHHQDHRPHHLNTHSLSVQAAQRYKSEAPRNPDPHNRRFRRRHHQHYSNNEQAYSLEKARLAV
jgi:hypothetical protein